MREEERERRSVYQRQLSNEIREDLHAARTDASANRLGYAIRSLCLRGNGKYGKETRHGRRREVKQSKERQLLLRAERNDQ